mmetsp:Transcript_72609/g.163069  ORF Transcript_72609/g.163069 Transcript_72609/m.163069 type:complete len:237 (-) Transcript_72609:32-742(-)
MWLCHSACCTGAEDDSVHVVSVDVLDAPTMIPKKEAKLRRGDEKAGSENQLEVSIWKACRGLDELGLLLDDLDASSAQICDITDGLVSDWNAKSERKVQVGDYIVDVKAPGDCVVAKLYQAMGLISFTVRRPKFLTVGAVKEVGGLGIDMSCKEDTAGLLIRSVREGPLLRWNKEHPDQALRPGDRIMSVNGKTGDPSALELAKAMDAEAVGSDLIMIISRPCSGAELRGSTAVGL